MEGEAAQFILSGTQMTLHAAKRSVEEVKNFIALLRAAMIKEKLSGKETLKKLLHSGAKLSVQNIPVDRLNEFKKECIRHGLVFAAIKNKGNNLKDVKVMFHTDDIERFNEVCKEMGLFKDKSQPFAEMSVDDVRESTIKKLEDIEKTQQKKTRPEYKPRVSEFDSETLRQSVMDINLNNLEAYTPDKWQAYLEVQNMLYSYSENNKNKIIQQRPDATIVMSKTAWSSIGRTPLPEAEGIKILMPEIVNGGRTKEYTDVTVYDISDTAGTDMNVASRFASIDQTDLSNVVRSIANDEANNVIRCDDALVEAAVLNEYLENNDAYFEPESQMIFLKEDITDEQKFTALQREMTYAQCFKEQGAAYVRSNNTLRADSVAYAISSKYGIDVKQNISFKYLDNMKKTTPEFIKKQKSSIIKDLSDRVKKNEELLKKVKAIRLGKER